MSTIHHEDHARPWLTCRQCEAVKDFALTEFHDFDSRVIKRDPANAQCQQATDREWAEARDGIYDAESRSRSS